MANGYYVTDADEARQVRDSGINRVMISIDSADPEEHDRKRGMPGAFSVATRAAQLLLEAGVPTVGFSTTIDVHNYHRLDDVVALARRIGVQAISFMQNRYNRPGIFDRALWIDYVAVCRELYELIVAHQNVLDIYTHDPFMLTLLDDRIASDAARADFIGANMCNVATSMVSIDPTGNVTGCNFIEEVIGNVRREPFIDIWNRLVARYSDRIEPPGGPCSGCAHSTTCVGGCKAFHYNGKYDERCGETRFGHDEPHRMTKLSLPLYPEAPLHRKAGVYARAGQAGQAGRAGRAGRVR
jgi:radical SAM protein with 4Fe4S-binding SPASM domain